jgi:hypothetical protein
MPILTDIPLTVTPADLLGARGKRRNRPVLEQAAADAVVLAATLWRPVALFNWVRVVGVEGSEAHIDGPEGPATLHLGPKAELLAPAREALVAVGTLGPALEQHVHALEAAGQGLKALLLDNVGVVAIGAVGRAVRAMIEAAAAEKGWGVGPSMAPGSLVGWPVAGQRELTALLPLEQIGARLTPYGVLNPCKSASWLVGMGPTYEAAHVGSTCKYCALAETCWRRREDGE